MIIVLYLILTTVLLPNFLPSRCTDGTNFLTVTYFLKTVLPLCDFIKELQA